MEQKLLTILGTWIFCDALYSLFVYWDKEGFKENSIRCIRAIVGGAIVALGMT